MNSCFKLNNNNKKKIAVFVIQVPLVFHQVYVEKEKCEKRIIIIY